MTDQIFRVSLTQTIDNHDEAMRLIDTLRGMGLVAQLHVGEMRMTWRNITPRDEPKVVRRAR